MDERRLKFVSIYECEIFLVRYFSRKFEDRAFFLPSQLVAVEAIEKSCKASSSWRLPSNHCCHTLEDFDNDCEVKKLIEKLKVADIRCGGCETNSPLTKHFDIFPQFTNDDESDDIRSEKRLCIDLLLCLLSSAVDYRDAWSVSRFFGRVCAEVLAPLRKRSEQTDGNLNIMSVLISYVMTASLEGTRGDDPILSANFNTIKNFTDTITKMTGLLQDDLPPNVAVHKLIEVAATYLRSLKYFANLSELSKLETFVSKHLAEIEANFISLANLASNNYQGSLHSGLKDLRRPSLLWLLRTDPYAERENMRLIPSLTKEKRNSKDFNTLHGCKKYLSIYTDKHALSLALRDRLVCLDCIVDIGAASPLFKSPDVTSTAACRQSPVDKSAITEEAQHTPSAPSDGRPSRFVRFETPVSGNVTVRAIGSLDVRIIEDAYGSDKENLDKHDTPIRRKRKNAPFRTRDMNRKHMRAGSNEEQLKNSVVHGADSENRRIGKPVINANSKFNAFCCITEAAHSKKVNSKGKVIKLINGQTKLTSFFRSAHNAE